MTTCAWCGLEAAGGARACARCGASLEPSDVVSAGPETAPRWSAGGGAASWGVDANVVRAAVRDTAVALGAQLAFLFAVAAFVGLALMPQGYHGDPVAWAYAAVYGAGMSLRAGLTMSSGDEGAEAFFGSGLAIYAMPLLGTIFGLAAVAYVARRREAAEPSPGRREVAGRAILTAAAYFVALAALALAIRAAPVYDEPELGLGLGSLLAGCLVLVGAAAALGRASAIARRAGEPGLRAALLTRAGAWAPAIRNAWSAFLLTAAGSAIYVYVVGMVDAEGVADRLRGTAAFLLLLPNVALVAGGVASGATLGLGGSIGAGVDSDSADASFGFGGSVGYGYVAGGVPGRFWPMLAVPVLAVLVVGLRAAARTHPGERSGWHRTGVVLAALWLAGALASQVGVSSSGSGSFLGFRGSGAAHGRAGLGIPSMTMCAFAFGTFLWVVRRFAAPNVAAAAPRAFARLGGSRLHEAWTVPGDVPWRREPRYARAVLTLSLAIVSLIAAGAAGAASYIREAGSPEHAARDYLEALAAGDAGAALSNTAVTGRQGADLLTREALAAQLAAAPIEDVRIRGSEVDGDEATVAYDFRAGGTLVPGTLELRKSGGGMVPRWKVTEVGAHVRVRVRGDVDEVRINGVAVAVVDDEAEATVFPGAVVVAIPENGAYAAAEEREFVSGPGENVSFSLEAELSDVAVQKIKAALDERARRCAALRTLELPEDCPFRDTLAFGEVSDVRWTIVTPPSSDSEVTLRFDGEIEIRGSMSLVVTYRETDFDGTVTPRREAVESSFGATATFSGDTVTIEMGFVF